MAGLINVEEALALILTAIKPMASETIELTHAVGRTLTAPVIAGMSQPPFSASAMDGYAVRRLDAAKRGARLKVVGAASAGARFAGALAPGFAIRIFTGAPIPEGADHILIQEDADRNGDEIIVMADQPGHENIRAAGIDFEKGSELFKTGVFMNGPRLALAAAGNQATISVARRPRVALIANGDELVLPGEEPGPDEIICSIPFGLAPMIESWGAEAAFLGVAPDNPDAICALATRALDYDLIVPIGGASVGDRDFMRAAFAQLGLKEAFSGVAMKPGKPTWFGAVGRVPVIGLPGNPASAFVAAALFVRPAIRRLLGRTDAEDRFFARTLAPLAANGPRENYLRAKFRRGPDGLPRVSAFADQDSSLLSVLAAADAFIRRPASAPAIDVGEPVECLAL